MLEGLRQSWRELKGGSTGRRFQDHYDRRHEGGESRARKWGFIGGGVAVVAAGIFFLPAPGPGMLIVLAGLGLIAQESRRAARALDWVEEKARPWLDRGREGWSRAGPAGRAGLLVLALVALVGIAVAAYRLFFG